METQTVRFWFSKTGRAKYISHLDLMRAMTRAFRRSHLPVWYTEGYHPHLHITFGQPLSLGFESDCEPMEVRATAPFDPKDAIQSLNNVLPPDIRVYACGSAARKLDQLVFSEYRITLRYENGVCPPTPEEYAAFSTQDEITVEKKTKRGVARFNLAPLLDMTRAETCGEGLQITAILPCGPQNHVNPSLITNAFAEYTRKDALVNVRRVAVFDEDLKPFSL